MAGVEIRMEGPLFDGRARQAIADACNDGREDVAEFAETMVLSELGHLLRHPTGYYESQIITDLVTSDTSLVHDQGVVYGPWLEGVGSRNSPVTRFPGYGHWRRVKGIAQARAPQIVERAINRRRSEMG